MTMNENTSIIEKIPKKTIDIMKEKIILDKKGIPISDVCIVPSELTANEFCDGFYEGIEQIKQLSGLDVSNLKFTCNIKKIEYDPKDLELSDSALNRMGLAEQTITIQKIDVLTGKLEEKGKFLSQRNEGIIDELEHCISPSKVLSEKYCKGFEVGSNLAISELKLNKDIFKSKCKSNVNVNNTKERTIYYGSVRII
jgi:hypothetical protein